MYYSVDRIIDDIAVLVDDDRNTLDVKVNDLPAGVVPGDVLTMCGSGYTFAPDEKERRLLRVRQLQSKLWKQNS